MTNDNPLYEIKQQLFDSLGEEKEKKYLYFLRLWCLGKLTCEQFHAEVSNITTGEQVTLSNKFIVLLLNSGFSGRPNSLNKNNQIEKFDKTIYQGNSSGSGGTKRKRGSSKSESYKAYVDWQDQNEFVLPTVSHHSMDNQMIRFAADELFLPDVEMVNGRFHVTAWEQKLTGVDSQIAEIVIQAIQIYLKNILTAIITKCRGFKVKDRFPYDIGVDVPNPWLRNTLMIDNNIKTDQATPSVYGNCIQPPFKPTLPEIEARKIFSISCATNGDERKRNFDGILTLQNMYHALKHNEKVIGNHMIYSSHMERIAITLRHVD